MSQKTTVSQLQSARPKSLFSTGKGKSVTKSNITFPPELRPPEFSISPADCVSKPPLDEIFETQLDKSKFGKSYENSVQASAINALQQSRKSMTRSPTSLSVNYTSSPKRHSGSLGNGSTFTLTSIGQGNASSSNADIAIETEQIEKAIKSNDTRFIQKLFDKYNNRLLFSSIKKDGDRSSQDSASLIDEEHDQEKGNLQTATIDCSRSELISEPDTESPLLFHNALHFAIEHNSYDVTVLLLKNGFDPNEPANLDCNFQEPLRRSSDSSHESKEANNSLCAMKTLVAGTSREQLIPHSSNHLNPIAASRDTYFFRSSNASDCNSSVKSDTSSVGKMSFSTRFITMRKDLIPEYRYVQRSDSNEDKNVTYENEYTREVLYSLPPIFMAVAMNNAPIVQALIKFGANVNFADKHNTTPLHLCVCQERVSKSCLHILLQNGGKIYFKNKLDVCPQDLLESKGSQLSELQKCLIENAFKYFTQMPSDVKKGIVSSSKTEVCNETSGFNSILIGNPSSSMSELKRISLEESSDEKVSCVLPKTGSMISINQPSTSSKSNFLKKLKGSKGKKYRKSSKGVNNNELDVFLCLEEFSSDGPSYSSCQGRESIFDTSSNKGDTDEMGPIGEDSFEYKLMISPSNIPLSSASEKDNHDTSNATASNKIINITSNRRKSAVVGIVPVNTSKSHLGSSSTKISSLMNTIRSTGNKSKSWQSKEFHSKQSNNKASTLDQWVTRAESAIQIIIKMAANIECSSYIIKEFQKNLSAFNSLIDKINHNFNMDKLIARLLSTILQTMVEEIDSNKLNENKLSQSLSEMELSKDEKKLLANRLCPLLMVSIDCLRGGQSLQYTALLMINKIIDVLIVYGLANTLVIEVEEVYLEKGSKKRNKKEERFKRKMNTFHSHKLPTLRVNKKEIWINECDKIYTQPTGSFKWISNISKKNFNSMEELHSKPSGKFKLHSGSSMQLKNQIKIVTSPLAILNQNAIDLLLNVLNNAITLHKRIQGSKQLCTPSHRWRHCTYHCLQILSARALLYISQSSEARKHFVEEGPLKVLISSLDSTHDPQLLCLILQIMASLAVDLNYQAKLIAAELPDILMHIILPSDEWFYTNHSTKYARYVKHHAARILVYLGLEKRLRNKVCLFDLLEETLQDTDSNHNISSILSEEDLYIMKTSLSINAKHPLSGVAENILLELLTQIEKRMSFGDSQDGDILTDHKDSFKYKPTQVNAPSIQVDLVTSDRATAKQKSWSIDDNISNLVNFYLSTLPFCVYPLIVIRLLRHRMFGCVSFWLWPSNAVSRSSVASSYGENKSRSGSAYAANIEDTLLRGRKSINLIINCQMPNYGQHKIENDRRPSLRNAFAEEKWPHSLSYNPQTLKQKFSFDRTISEPISESQNNTPTLSPQKTSNAIKIKESKPKRARSTDTTLPPFGTKNDQFSTQEEIVLFQRELQNIPKNESTSPIPSRTFPTVLNPYYSNAFSHYIQDSLDRITHARPRSCSVPRVTYENVSLQIPSALQHHRSFSPATSAIHFVSLQKSPILMDANIPYSNRSPLSLSLSPSPSSSSVRRSTSHPYTHNNSDSPIESLSDVSNLNRNEPIMPNSHKAILSLLLHWSQVCPMDLKQNEAIRRELNELLCRISVLGEQYQWKTEEIRICADLQDGYSTVEDTSNDAVTSDEYKMLQQLVISGNLLCSKEEACALAGIQLRIEETSSNRCTSRMNMHGEQNEAYNNRAQSMENNSNEIRDDNLTRPRLFSSIYGKNEEAKQLGGGFFQTATNFVTSKSSNHSDFRDSNTTRANDFLKTFGDVTRRTSYALRFWISNTRTKSDISSKGSSINLRECLPPIYCNSKGIAKVIKEQKRKLFHSQIYENEIQLKKLYIQSCKRMPSYGCQMFQVKEILKSKTSRRRVTRLLGLGLERIILLDSKTLIPAKCQSTKDLQEWRISGGSNHDRITLEFRATKWSVTATSQGSLQAIGNTLWGIMQDIDSHFFCDLLLTNFKDDRRDYFLYKPLFEYKEELEMLQSMLHFPEEVALGLSDVEYRLFYSVSPVDYIRYITVNLGCQDESKCDLNGLYYNNTGAGLDSLWGNKSKEINSSVKRYTTVHDLVKRFNEVSSWITHMIISQATHEERKAVLSCIIRVAQYAWNIGAFNTALEIITGLKSKKLRPFWLSIKENERPVLLDTLTKALMFKSKPSREYRDAIKRSLNIPQSKVIPFFGNFLRDLYAIFENIPSLVVLPNYASSEDSKCGKSNTAKLEFISDFNGEDHFMSRIGVGGIINVQKMQKAQTVLDNIRAFHSHAARRQELIENRETLQGSNGNILGSNDKTEPIKESDAFYEITLTSYIPIQPFHNDHGISFVPINENTIDLHVVQAMNRGSTVIHYEEDTGKSACVYFKLEKSNGLLAWCKPPWSNMKSSASASYDYNLNIDIEEVVIPSIFAKHECKEPAIAGLEEGYLDLMYVKQVFVNQINVDQAGISRRSGLKSYALDSNCFISLLYGINLSDNRFVHFIFPKMTAAIWADGLKSILKQLQIQKNLSDQRVLWLKSKYLQLYYQNEACVGPTPAEAIKAFGGRNWTLDAVSGSVQSNIDLNTKRTSSFGLASSKLRKKKSTTSLSTVRDNCLRSQSSIGSDATNEINLSLKSKSSPMVKKKGRKITSVLSFKSKVDESKSSRSDLKTLDSFSSTDSSSLSTSSKNLKSSLESLPLHTSSLTCSYQEKLRRGHTNNKEVPSSPGSESISAASKFKTSIPHLSQMNFLEFMKLYRAFLIRSRKDIKDIFENLASKTDIHSLSDNNQEPVTTLKINSNNSVTGILTRNFSPTDNNQRNKICDAIASASIVANCAGVDTLRNLLLTVEDFQSFFHTYQNESPSLEEVKKIIAQHEPDLSLRQKNCLSFEGFACYLMDKNNYAFTPELLTYSEEDMNEPLSHYYIATSHNTYLTGHQLKGESSVELYSQVLLTGCRCVELDCHDGDEGMPIIYHGHTLTSKIPFRKVVEAINENAFVASPFPVILSIENHCSLQQQVKMAQTFISVFGEKLITKFLFEADFSDEPHLPTPNQLKYRIIIKNKKLRAPILPTILLKSKQANGAKFTPHRTNSLVSATSTGSLNEDEDDYDDEDDDDDINETGEQTFSNLSKTVRTDSSFSQEGGSFSVESKQPISKAEIIDIFDISSEPVKPSHKVIRKSNSQVAPELSDLVIYCQAIKFRGFGLDCGASSPTSIAKEPVKKIASKKNILSPISTPSLAFSSNISNQAGCDNLTIPSFTSSTITLGSGPLNSSPSTVSSISSSSFRRPCVSCPCYQVISLNEHSAKKLCRKHPLLMINHTENQLMRSYPAGMRIDSSNFNPVIFWAFGIQMVALNYQTEDPGLAINKAMFEQNGLCGYVLKPSVMRDKTHMMFDRFNPWEKEFDGLYAVDLTITVISGQYVCPDINTGSPVVEVEIIGNPVDCNKQRTNLVQRNSLNPIWNNTFKFRITFADLAFVRFSIIDISTNHVTSQRVVPVKAIRQGYRHLRLKSAQNQPLPLSSLFIYVSSQEEGMEIGSSIDFGLSKEGKVISEEVKKSSINLNDFVRFDGKDAVTASVPVRRKMCFIVVYGVVPDEPSTILKITQESTASEVIAQALSKANKSNENTSDYVLIEEISKGWDRKGNLLDHSTTTQRIIDPKEKPLEMQANWKSEGRFVLKKIADDPSSRAWFNTIKAASLQKEKLKRQDSDELSGSWSDDTIENFLVCIYNVSEDQPYAILKASVSCTAQDIIGQALLKARRMESPQNFVLLEEIEIENEAGNSGQAKCKHRESTLMLSKRILDQQENVYLAQAGWKGKGLFRLVKADEVNLEMIKNEITSSPDFSFRNSRAFHRMTRNAKGSLKKLNRFSRFSRITSTTDGESGQSKSGSIDSRASEIQSLSDNKSELGEDQQSLKESLNQQVTKEDTLEEAANISDFDDNSKFNISFSKLKRLSIRKLKVWKS